MVKFLCKDLTHGESNELVFKLGGVKKVRQILSGELEIHLIPVDPPAPVSVPSDQILIIDPSLSFKERIQRSKCTWRKKELTENHFPITRDQYGEWEWQTFCFGTVSPEKAIQLMKKEGFKPGNIIHLLAFSEKYSEELPRYPINALGSIVEFKSEHHTPVLWNIKEGTPTRLLLFKFDNCCSLIYTHFLGVRRPLVSDLRIDI